MTGIGRIALALVAVANLLSGFAYSQTRQPVAESKTVVLTDLQPTYSITSVLAQNTDIEVINVPAGGRSMQALPGYYETRADRLSDTFRNATAVVTLAYYWNQDPLYVFARAENIRVIPIDASKPWSVSLSGVGIINSPQTDAPWAPRQEVQEPSYGQYFWLSTTNGIRMADTIAADLVRIAPADAERIKDNLTAFKQQLWGMKNGFEKKLLELGDPNLFALANEFVYFTNEAGLFVQGYFLKQDIQWNESDYQALQSYLAEHKIDVVIHKWQPSAEIEQAIKNGGARLVVLNTADPGIIEDRELARDGYQQVLQQNMDSLIDAISK